MKKLKNVIAVLTISGALALAACGGKSDTTIKTEVDGRIKNPAVTAEVKDGVVTLKGTVANQEAAKAAVAAAKGEGVKEVKDTLQFGNPAKP